MTFNTLIVVLGLLSLLFFIGAIRKFRLRRIAGGFVSLLLFVLLVVSISAALGLSFNLQSYQRLTAEQPAGTLDFKRIGYHQFNGVLTLPSGESAEFELRGDEWQVDARLLKWHGLADLLGFDTAYRLDRISGRYTNIDDERSQPRTVFPLNAPERVDLWTLTQRYHSWLPWVDALYGSAAFLPMADGARYVLTVSQSGLVARPVNQTASQAVGEWR